MFDGEIKPTADISPTLLYDIFQHTPPCLHPTPSPLHPSAFVVSVWQPRVRATKRSLVLGAALGDRHGGLATAHGTTATAHAAHTAQRAHTLHTAQRAHTVHTAQRAHTARWRQGTVRPAAGLGGLGLGGSQRTPLPLPTQSLSPLSTLDRHGSAFR